ncbi:hypothetical protein Syun_022886 [Stephania yunnanensis]|uniref:Uncharacterized protein n=1 Tax=Stephania yunnanensis TaxID=152371 RepID=A0AAP0I344_9MAGN
MKRVHCCVCINPCTPDILRPLQRVIILAAPTALPAAASPFAILVPISTSRITCCITNASSSSLHHRVTYFPPGLVASELRDVDIIGGNRSIVAPNHISSVCAIAKHQIRTAALLPHKPLRRHSHQSVAAVVHLTRHLYVVVVPPSMQTPDPPQHNHVPLLRYHPCFVVVAAHT